MLATMTSEATRTDQLRHALRAGEVLTLSSASTAIDVPDDGTADLSVVELRAVLLDPDLRPDSHGLVLHGARVDGDIDFASTDLPCRVIFVGCRVEGVVDLSDCRSVHSIEMSRCAATRISMTGSRIAGGVSFNGTSLTSSGELPPGTYVFDAASSQIGGDLRLNQGFASAGPVRLTGARIKGQLDLGGASIAGADTDGDALTAEHSHVDGSAFLGGGFTAAGGLRLSGMRVGGQLGMAGASITSANTLAISLLADRVQVSGLVYLGEGFTAVGTVRFQGARIGGQLAMPGAIITAVDASGAAFIAEGMQVDESVFMNDGFKCVGTVNLHGAQVGGQLVMQGVSINSASGEALRADDVQVKGGVFLSGDFQGAVRLHSAKIGGLLDMRGSIIAGVNTDGKALVGGRMEVGGSVFLRDGFAASGTVDFTSARIGGQLEMQGAAVIAASSAGQALTADAARFDAGVYLSDGFSARGVISFVTADLGPDLDVTDACLAESTLMLEHAHVGTLWLRAADQPKSIQMHSARIERVTTPLRDRLTQPMGPTLVSAAGLPPLESVVGWSLGDCMECCAITNARETSLLLGWTRPNLASPNDGGAAPDLTSSHCSHGGSSPQFMSAMETLTSVSGSGDRQRIG